MLLFVHSGNPQNLDKGKLRQSANLLSISTLLTIIAPGCGEHLINNSPTTSPNIIWTNTFLTLGNTLTLLTIIPPGCGVYLINHQLVQIHFGLLGNTSDHSKCTGNTQTLLTIIIPGCDVFLILKQPVLQILSPTLKGSSDVVLWN